MSSQPICVPLYSVRDALAGDPPGTLQRPADLGFRDVELYGFVERPQNFASALAAAGLTASSSGQACPLDLEVRMIADLDVTHAAWRAQEFDVSGQVAQPAQLPRGFDPYERTL